MTFQNAQTIADIFNKAYDSEHTLISVIAPTPCYETDHMIQRFELALTSAAGPHRNAYWGDACMQCTLEAIQERVAVG